MAADQLHRVVIVGGGFGGLYCAQALRSSPVRVTLIDRRNFHLFQPLLYQVATGALSAANIAAPLRAILSRQANTHVMLAEVVGFDAAAKQVQLADGETVPYDTLVVAAGSSHHYFGHDDWELHAPGLKTIEDATEIRRRVLMAFEKAERETDPDAVRTLLTFVVIGGGPTGVEMAGAISELAKSTLRCDFRTIDPTMAKVILVEGQPRLIPSFHEKLSAKAKKYLEEMGIELVLDSHVTSISATEVVVTGDAGSQSRTIQTETLVWAAGVKASPLGKKLAEALGATGPAVEVGKGGHVATAPDWSVPGHPEVFVLGDMASLKTPEGKAFPGVATVAMQSGRYAATVIHARVKNMVPPGPFRYWDKGSMATVGRGKAVAESYGIRLSGTIAWLAWLFVHVFYIAQFSSRVLITIQWVTSYVTRGRSARLITGEHQADRTAILAKRGPKPAPSAPGSREGSGDARNGLGDGASAPAPAPLSGRIPAGAAS